MTLTLDNLDLVVRLPEMPKSMPVFELTAPTLEDRRPGLDRLRELLRLGELRSAEFDHALVMAGDRGEIEFFPASGAVWARDATATQDSGDELRRWEQLEESEDEGGPRLTLSRDAADRLISQSREMLDGAGLLGSHLASEAVELDQVASLDARGREVERGAGSATVKFSYAVEGVPARGAGAKTLAFAEPGDGEVRFSGAFHAWRTVGEARDVELPDIETSLGVGLLVDPELVPYHDAGHKIRITRLELVYLALPAFMRQTHLTPAFQVEGEVSKGRRGAGFNFGRFHHAVPPRAFAAADLFGPNLSVNPDGISAPAPPRQQQQG